MSSASGRVISSDLRDRPKGLLDMRLRSHFIIPVRNVLRRHSLSPLRAVGACLLLCVTPLPGYSEAAEQAIHGSVRDADGTPIVGAMISLRQGTPFHERTVFTNHDGAYRTRLLADQPFGVRVRRIGWRDQNLVDVSPLTEEAAASFDFTLEREVEPAALAAQLPSNRWLDLLLTEIDDPSQREEFVRQCTYCHQQGSVATRLIRTDEEWQKLLSLMARMGGVLSPELREQIPMLWRRAYDPERSVAALVDSAARDEFAPAPEVRVLRAAVDEWALGHAASMQHDLAVHPDGRIYSVDMMQDKLYRFDPVTEKRDDFSLPDGGLPLGGVFGAVSGPLPPYANARVGPHSLQVAPDGAIWMTLALGSQLARFDTESEAWTIHDLEEGIYPHTLRFDHEGRIWYTMAVSNHVGLLDPSSGEQTSIRLPATSFRQALALRLLPVGLWLSQFVDFSDAASGEGGGAGVRMPVPYGIDVAPNGDIWFSQLNENRIGRIDPKTLDVEMVDTPFTAPRRLRFDSRGRLWIPGFSSGLISRFDPETREFKSYPLPIEPLGTETPYALNVHPDTDDVWICGTNSDSLIRFDPDEAEFTVYPLPTRVTYTREIDFDAEGRIWTSNSNLPAWQIEDGTPRILRLDPTFQPEVEIDMVGLSTEGGK
jgi:virginiamycin B lyase